MVKQIITQKLTSMKKLTYIITVLLAVFALCRCAEDPIDRRISSADFFVTFETHNAVNKTLSITEGDTAVITVTIGATLGGAVTVDFDVTPSTVTNPASAAYELLKMDDTPLTTKTLTFPEGTGSQSFKFVATDNDDIDGNRTFTLKLTGVSNNYRVGVNATGEGATLPVAVKDDDKVLTIEELMVGKWEVQEDLFYNSAWHEGLKYSVAVTKVDETTINIKGLCQIEDIEVTATVNLNTKKITIPFQSVTTLDPDVDCYFSQQAATGITANYGTGFNNLAIEEDDDGILSFSLGTAYTYEISAATPGSVPPDGWLGFFYVGYATQFVKQP
jgi:archaellum component FlaF (FlaF/FlaG flagellin family)